MSQLKLSGDASGTGIVTVAAPNTNSTYTVTLPAAAGTIVTGAAGSDTQVQFNDGGSTFGGDAGLTYNKTTDTLTTGVVVHGAGTVSAPSITTTGDTNTGVFFPAADTAAITTGGTERMRIDSSGQLLINTTTARSPATYTAPKLQIEATSYTQAGVSIVNNQNGNDQSFIVLGKSRGTTVGSVTAVQNNDTLGDFSFNGADGTGLIAAARIFAEVDGTPGTNDMPGRLIFGTTADGAAAPTERMRINANGTIKTSSTISVGGATPSTSGCGITFPATENLSTNGNTLDDYEEGTWTPTVYGQSTAGTTTYTGQAGRYNKVGNMVTVIAKVDYSAATGTGTLLIGGLPFTTYTDSGALRYPGVLWTNNLNWTFGTYVTVWTGGTDSTTLQIIGSSDDGALTNEQQLVNEAAGFAFSMTYRTS